MEQKREKKYIVGSILCGLLTAFGIVAAIISLLNGSNGLWAVSDCAIIVLLVLICFYCFYGYKKPHGNLLKYIILIYAALGLTAISTYAGVESIVTVILEAVKSGLLCYIAGRLAKAKENIIFILMITVILVAQLVLDFAARVAAFGEINLFVPWIDLCVAYFLRYKEHREAGLEDAPKK